jgi:hypothetical protein
MKLYIVQFYDHNQSGNVLHNEVYTTEPSARKRFEYLMEHLNGYSWVCLFEGITKFGRVRCGDCIAKCSACNGDDDWYHGDDDDF